MPTSKSISAAYALARQRYADLGASTGKNLIVKTENQ